ncbi:MAG: glucuronate isomerase [Ruminococcus sp.]|uniref:glucuronate isomerase n=1 Tax=Ruminococcus sp. TaxID=41978 RepID=UPI003993688D
MRTIIHDDFILKNETARALYHQSAESLPIIDFHNHLNPQEIYEDRCYDNLAEVWLGGDHYKWRAMRANGVPEELITGDGDPYEKFLAWADTVQNCIGNPLYHWTHLELKRYFGIDDVLTPETAPAIWEKCNALLKTPEYSIRNLLKMQNVEVLCTTDNPIDDLKWHKKLAEEGFEIQVLPTFRPGRALDIEKDDFADYIAQLGECTDLEIHSLDDVLQALKKCLAYFIEDGCRVTDHSLESDFFLPASLEEADYIYQKRMSGETLSLEETAKYRGFVLTELGREYSRNNLVMQLHIGAIRNNSLRMFQHLGDDTGFDSLNDFNYAPQLSALLNAMDLTEELPKTVLYYLNSKDADMLAAMAGNYQSNTQNIRGKVQLGSAWWFCDHKRGMERQMNALADTGLISTFIGMLTDSRSFLSFPRHEYFRRILCNLIGSWVEDGEYPADMPYLNTLVQNICYTNAKQYFQL